MVKIINDERLFNNSYLNCYFQIQNEKLNLRLGDSLEKESLISKEEEMDLNLKITNEHAFNHKPMFSFWSQLI